MSNLIKIFKLYVVKSAHSVAKITSNQHLRPYCQLLYDMNQPCHLYILLFIQECPTAFVFFKTRHAAVVASEVLQSANPMSWVTELAPEPKDVLWSNLSIPYRQLWIRKVATLLASLVFMVLFLAPVTFVQGLTQLDTLEHTFPFLKGLLKQ